jgi:hypothetical protein
LDKIAALSKDVKDLKEQQKTETQQADVSTHRSSTAALRLSEEIITSGRKLYRESIRSGTITRSSTNATLVGTAQSHELHDTPEGADGDKDDEFAYEIADATAEAAQAAFESQDWTSTIAYFEELMRGIKRGSFRWRPEPAVASFDLIHMHAISIFHTGEPSMAKVRLVMATEQPATTDDQRRKSYYAQHCLSITCVRLSQLEAANETCKSALEGRRSLLGRQDEAFLDSLGLMSRIHELQGNQFRARIYLTMIPESRVDMITAKYRDVLPSDSVDSRRDSLPVKPFVLNDVAGLGIAALRLNESSRISKSDEPAISGAEEGFRENSSSSNHGRPQLFAANTEEATSTLGISGTFLGGNSTLLLSPTPDFSHQDGTSLHRRNQSAPSGSRTVPGSPLLPSPKALEPTVPSTRPLGTTGLFRGISGRARRTWLTSLNLYPSGDVERAICKGDLMALHTALSKDSQLSWLSASKGAFMGHSKRRALHLAALFGDVRMAHTLIIAGADVHATTPKLVVPSRYSYLLAQTNTYESETALHLAIGSRQAPMVEFLVSQGASLYNSRLGLDLPTANLLDLDWLRVTQCSGFQEIVDVLQVLLYAGWDLNSPLSVHGPDRDNVVQRLIRTPNCPFDRWAVLQFCLDNRFDIGKADPWVKVILENAFTQCRSNQ